MKALVGALILLASLSASAQMDLKGVSPGQAMVSCPVEATAKPIKTGETLCIFGPTTLANQEVLDYTIAIYEGKVVNLLYRLKDKGFSASPAVREALIEKFGQPSVSKSHINQYSWMKSGQVLFFDGLSGAVVLQDVALYKRIQSNNAGKNKSDL